MRLLPAGIYTPLPCFFDDNEDLGKSKAGHTSLTSCTLMTKQISNLSGSMSDVCQYPLPFCSYLHSLGFKIDSIFSYLVTAKAGTVPVVSGSMGEAVHLVRFLYSLGRKTNNEILNLFIARVIRNEAN